MSTVFSTVRVVKCEKQSRDERRQASSTHRGVRRPLFAQDDDEVFLTGSTLYAGDEGRSKPPGHNPPGHNIRFLLPYDIIGQKPVGIFVEN